MRGRLNYGCLVALAITAVALDGAEKRANSLDAPASDQRIRVPLVGLFSPEGQAELRPILGLPGAAVFGESFRLQPGLRDLVVSPNGAYALATDGDRFFAITSLNTGIASTELEALQAPARLLAFSADGSAAALLTEETRRLYVLPNLPASASPREIDLRSLSGDVISAAMSDRAELIALGTFDGHSGSIDVIAPDGSYERVWTGGRPQSVRFAGNRLLVSDSAEGRVLLLSRGEDRWEAHPLAGPDEGIEDPGQIEVSHDHTWALVANRTSNSLVWVELAGSKTRKMTLPSAVQGLTSFHRRGAILVSTREPEGHWFFNTVADEPVLTFISDPIAGARGR
jgi:hypothetical protein